MTAPASAEPIPLVSVIMPFLNGEKFIEEAIESVFAQTYRNWELLPVDDGSTDASSQIARRFARDHPEKFATWSMPDIRTSGRAPHATWVFAMPWAAI